MKTKPEMIIELRGIAQFYRDSPNMSEDFLNVWRDGVHYGLTCDDLFRLADFLEETAGEL